MILLNDHPVTPTIFPDKTSQVWHLTLSQRVALENEIEWRFENEGEFMHLAQLQCLLCSFHPEMKTTLFLPYLPYGRQDKPASNDASFALQPFAFLINELNFNEVIITDPHSDVAEKFIMRSRAEYPLKEVLKAYIETKSDLVCYPDSGALTKYSKVYASAGFEFISGTKIRNPSSGHIENYTLNGGARDKTVMIIDDICDGGATFIVLADALRHAGAKEINLFVSHGIFSKGVNVLFEAGINRIFTKKGEKSYDTSNFI